MGEKRSRIAQRRESNPWTDLLSGKPILLYLVCITKTSYDIITFLQVIIKWSLRSAIYIIMFSNNKLRRSWL